MSQWKRIPTEDAEALIKERGLKGNVNRSFDPPLLTLDDPEKPWPECVVLKIVSQNPTVYARREGA